MYMKMAAEKEQKKIQAALEKEQRRKEREEKKALKEKEKLAKQKCKRKQGNPKGELEKSADCLRRDVRRVMTFLMTGTISGYNSTSIHSQIPWNSHVSVT